MTRRLHWLDYSTTEYVDIDPAKTIVILPTAAIEQHVPLHVQEPPAETEPFLEQEERVERGAHREDDVEAYDVQLLEIQEGRGAPSVPQEHDAVDEIGHGALPPQGCVQAVENHVFLLRVQ